MGFFVWLAGIVAGVIASILVDRAVKAIMKDPKWTRYIILGLVFMLTFIGVALVASPKARDIARAIIKADGCYFSNITAPDGATKEIDAPYYQIPLATPITWEPNNCIMVVQSYQQHVFQRERKGQRSNKIAVNDVVFTGITELKIFREGFYTESDKIWIEVVP
jgi:hypothetical protein